MENAMSSSLSTLRALSTKLGDPLSTSAEHFCRCARLADEVREAPVTGRSRSAALASLGAASDDVDEAVLNAPSGHPLKDHLAALGSAVRAFSCVDTPNPPGAVADARAFTGRSIRAVRVRQESIHKEWADALDQALSALQSAIASSAPIATTGMPGHTSGQSASSRTSAAPRARFEDTTSSTKYLAERQSQVPAAMGSYNAANNVSAGIARFSQTKQDTSSTKKKIMSPAPASKSRFVSTPTCSHLADYHNHVAGEAVKNLVLAASALDKDPRTGPVAAQARAVEAALRALGGFLNSAATTPKPQSTNEIQSMLGPVASQMQNVGRAAEAVSPRDTYFNHLTAVAESMGMLSWVMVDSKPVSSVVDAEAAAEFYLAKVQMSSKLLPNSSDHTAFVTALRQLFAAMKGYIRDHHPSGLRWNLGLEDIPAIRQPHGPRVSGESQHSSVMVEGDNELLDSPSAFRAILHGPLAAYASAANALGSDMRSQTDAFVAAWKAEEAFLTKAAASAKPAEPDFSGIADHMGNVSELAQAYPPRGPLTNHLTAVGESVAALGWIAVDSGSAGFVGDQAGAGQFYIDKVKMSAKSTDMPKQHLEWARYLEELFTALKSFVKDYHPNALQWNAPYGTNVQGRASASSRQVKSTVRSVSNGGANNSSNEASHDGVFAFRSILESQLARYVLASNALGTDMKAQTDAFVTAWKAEELFLANAAVSPKPTEPDFSDIAAHMGQVSDLAQEYPPRGLLSNHLTAVGESVAALGWIAVDSGATGFVGDQAGAGQFYIDKVKMGAKSMDAPHRHLEWAASLEELFVGLKSFVKQYHVNSLQWNTRTTSQHVRSGVATRKSATQAARDGRDTTGDVNALSAFADFVRGAVRDCVDSAVSIGGGLAPQANAMFDAFKAEYKMICDAAGMGKPSQDVFEDMIDPIGLAMGVAADCVQSVGPRDRDFNLMTAMAESVPALGWIAVDSKPKLFVSEYVDAGAFYTSKALMEARSLSAEDREKVQLFVRNFKEMYAQLGEYIDTYHRTGLVWNAKWSPPSTTLL